MGTANEPKLALERSDSEMEDYHFEGGEVLGKMYFRITQQRR